MATIGVVLRPRLHRNAVRDALSRRASSSQRGLHRPRPAPARVTAPASRISTRPRWPDWADAVEDAFDAMRSRRAARVAVVGQSLGGLLALHLASSAPRSPRSASLAAPLWLEGLRRARRASGPHRAWPAARRIRTLPKLGGSDIRDPARRRPRTPGYTGDPGARARRARARSCSIVDDELPRSRSPCSSCTPQHDHTAPVALRASRSPSARTRRPHAHPAAQLSPDRRSTSSATSSPPRSSTSCDATYPASRDLGQPMRHVIAIDQGTTGIHRARPRREARQCAARGYREFRQIYPQPGWVEHDPEDIWASVLGALGAGARSGIDAATDRRDRHHQPARDHGAVGSQDRQARAQRDRLAGPPHRRPLRRAQGRGQGGRASRSAPGWRSTRTSRARRSRWMLDNVAGPARAARDSGELAFGTVDSFLLWRLTGGARARDRRHERLAHAAVRHRARSRGATSCCELFGVPRALLPEVVPSSGPSATRSGVPALPDGIPIAGIAGDQQAALFGQACFDAGRREVHVRHRRVHPDEHRRPRRSQSKRPAHHRRVEARRPARLRYALEGSAFIAGAAVQWLRDGLGIITNAAEIEALARSVPDSGGVIVVPALAGSRRAALAARRARLDHRHHARHDARRTSRAPTLEGIALQNVDILRAMERDAGRAAHDAQGRRRRRGERSADAVPERRARRRDLAPRARRVDRARRGVPRRPRHRRVEGLRSRAGDVARAAPVQADGRSRVGQRAPRALGRRCREGLSEDGVSILGFA